MTYTNKLLEMALITPEDFAGTTVGLLGNFDDDNGNDFIPRNANAAIANTSTERQIFSVFGQTCE